MAAALPPPPAVGGVGKGERLRVRDLLVASGLDSGSLERATQLGGGQLDVVRLPLLRSALADEPILLLFAYGVGQPRSALEAVLDGDAIDVLRRFGLLAVGDDGTVHSPVRLLPMAGLLVACDHHIASAPSLVMGPGPTTAELAWAMPRPPEGRVLDVGTGAGSLALLAAAQGAPTVATDITKRAVAFARFNAAFNGVELDVRPGSLLEPVKRELFDLVVSQPPFVMQPSEVDSITYVHGGETGEELALELIRGLPEVLADDGIALLRLDTLDDGGFAARAHAVAPALDVVVFGYQGAEIDLVALGYGILADPTLGATFEEAAGRYYRHGRLVAGPRLRSTITVLRRRAGAGDAVEAEVGVRRAPRWPEIAARLAALDAAANDDRALLAIRLSPPVDARLAAEQDLDAGGREPAYLVRFPADGLLADNAINETGAALLQLFAGGVGVAAVLGAYAEGSGMPAADAAADVLAFVRDALQRGLLTPCAPNG